LLTSTFQSRPSLPSTIECDRRELTRAAHSWLMAPAFALLAPLLTPLLTAALVASHRNDAEALSSYRGKVAVAPLLLQKPGVSATLHKEPEERLQPMPQFIFEDTPLSLEASALHEGMQSSARSWRVLVSAGWHRWSPPPTLREYGAYEFFLSVGLFEWCLFGCAMTIAVLFRCFLLSSLASMECFAVGLLPWLVLAASYNAVIWMRLGQDHGLNWLAGYLLEFIFLVENVFIFQIVVGAFKLPKRHLAKVLYCVVCGQILFEMVFFMGLALRLRHIRALPYILGIWLICCGVSSFAKQSHADIDILDTAPVRAVRACCGDRLSVDEKEAHGRLLLNEGGKTRVSLLGLAVIVMLAADFLLEIDVVLTKIEELPNAYVSFSSSALAALGIPELFFLSQGLLRRFALLRHGIGFVLCLFGAQMLLSSVFVLPPLLACCIVVGVLVGCVVLSALQNHCCPDKPEEDANGGQPIDRAAAIEADAG